MKGKVTRILEVFLGAVSPGTSPQLMSSSVATVTVWVLRSILYVSDMTMSKPWTYDEIPPQGSCPAGGDEHVDWKKGGSVKRERTYLCVVVSVFPHGIRASSGKVALRYAGALILSKLSVCSRRDHSEMHHVASFLGPTGDELCDVVVQEERTVPGIHL